MKCIRPAEMQMLTVLSHKSLMRQIVELLYDFDVYHIEEVKETEDLTLGRPMASAEQLSGLLVKVRAVLSFLKISSGSISFNYAHLANVPRKLDSWEQEINVWHRKIKNLEADLQDTEAELQKVEEKIRIVEPIIPLSLDLAHTQGTDSLAVQLGIVGDLDEINHVLKKHQGHYSLESVHHEKKDVVALFIDRKQKDDIMHALQKTSFQPISLALLDEKERQGKPRAVYQHLKETSKVLSGKHDSLDKRKDQLAKSAKKKLLEFEELLTIELDKGEIPLKFGTTQETFMITGYVPKKDTQKSNQSIRKNC